MKLVPAHFIIINMFTADVLSESVIMKWYKEGHSVKGKMMFLDQMKKFVEWLQNAEEGLFMFNIFVRKEWFHIIYIIFLFQNLNLEKRRIKLQR